jgi:Ankyrin repeats (3 copies)/Ankyrin repeat
MQCQPSYSRPAAKNTTFLAVQRGQLATVQYFVSECQVDPSVCDSLAISHLHAAAFQGHLDIVQYLVSECNVNPLIRNLMRRTPLHEAALGGHLDVAQYLISDCMVDPCVADNQRSTPLHYAAQNGHLEIVQYLVSDCQVDPCIGNLLQSTPLREAACNGHLDTVQFLMQHPATARRDIGTTVEMSWSTQVIQSDSAASLLTASASRGHSNIVKWLLERYVSEVSDADMHSALQRALVEDRELDDTNLDDKKRAGVAATILSHVQPDTGCSFYQLDSLILGWCCPLRWAISTGDVGIVKQVMFACDGDPDVEALRTGLIESIHGCTPSVATWIERFTNIARINTMLPTRDGSVLPKCGPGDNQALFNAVNGRLFEFQLKAQILDYM